MGHREVPLADLSLKARLRAGLLLLSISRAAALNVSRWRSRADRLAKAVRRLSGPLERFVDRMIGAIEGSARFRQGNRQRGP
jgi:hypothetical protein